MNATVQKVQDKRELYWKSARARIWIRYFGYGHTGHVMPPPFNLPWIFFYIYSACCIMKNKARGKEFMSKYFNGKEEHQKKHQELMIKLLKRCNGGKLK